MNSILCFLQNEHMASRFFKMFFVFICSLFIGEESIFSVFSNVLVCFSKISFDIRKDLMLCFLLLTTSLKIFSSSPPFLNFSQTYKIDFID